MKANNIIISDISGVLLQSILKYVVKNCSLQKKFVVSITVNKIFIVKYFARKLLNCELGH